MPYPEFMVAPMREDLVKVGFRELRTPQDVDEVLGRETRTVLVAVNSVCGCAAGNARPGVKLALRHSKLPQKVTTVFAGVDAEATQQARSYIPGYPPSSPSIALFKDGQPVFVMERHMIEGRAPQEIAFDLVTAFDEHC